MKKDIFKKVVVLSSCVLLLAGCGKTKVIPKLENGEDAVATLNDGTKIGINELYNKMKEAYGLETIINMIDKNILEKEYSGDLEAAKEYAENTMASLKESYGDDLLSAIKYYTSFNTLEEYQDYVYLSYLQNKAVEDYAKNEITEKDINKYYKDEIKPDIKVSHILFTVDYADNATDDEKTQAKNDAKAKAEDVLNILKSTSKNDIASKFSELAKEKSQDNSTKDDGGNLGFINKDTLSDSYQELVDAAYKLKDGEYSSTIVETELGYHIVYRTETKEKASLEEVKDSIIENLTTNYISEHNDASIKAMQNIRKKYGLELTDEELANNYKTYIQNALLSAQENSNK